MRDRYLEEFKLAASGLRGPSPAKLNRDEWWALGKHYGLVSPLLDWSEGPYVAAFFALADLHQRMAQDTPGELVFTGERAAVYRLVHDERLEDDHLRVVRPIVEELGRMHGQRGLFTWLDSEEFFELEGYLESVGKIGRLTRVVISDQAVLDGLRDLEAHGITYRALFPDLVGAAQYANAKFTLGF